jgi:hypothetical protein
LFADDDGDTIYDTASGDRTVQMTATPQNIYITGISTGELQADSL